MAVFFHNSQRCRSSSISIPSCCQQWPCDHHNDTIALHTTAWSSRLCRFLSTAGPTVLQNVSANASSASGNHPDAPVSVGHTADSNKTVLTNRPASPAAAVDSQSPPQTALARPTVLPVIPNDTNATWPTAVAAIWPSNRGTPVPETFLATSHEWKRMTDYGETAGTSVCGIDQAVGFNHAAPDLL
jgi:hypothetical protein